MIGFDQDSKPQADPMPLAAELDFYIDILASDFCQKGEHGNLIMHMPTS